MASKGLPTDIDEIDAEEIRTFIAHLQAEVKADENNPRKPAQQKALSAHRLQGYARAIRAFFSWVVREGFLEEHPVKGVRLPRVPKLVMPSFTETQVRKLLDPEAYEGIMSIRNHAILTLLLDTGVRVSELTGLRMKDLHLEEGYFKVRGKGARERIVPVGKESLAALWRYVLRFRPELRHALIDNVFLTRDGRPMTQGWVYRIVANTCTRIGIKGSGVGPHTCRHTFAKNFLVNGGDLLTLQRILGHSSLEVVRMYVDLNTKDLIEQQSRFSPVDKLRQSMPAGN